MVDAIPALRFAGAGAMTDIRDAVVIGGGPAGSTLAQLLAAAGRHVTLVERTRGPHDKVCGEFLSHEALHYLHLLGVHPRELGAVPIETIGLAAGRQITSQRLPFHALSLSRRVLDETLIDAARVAGADIRRGTSVTALDWKGQYGTARLADGGILSARDVFVATGKHDLRGWKRPPASQNDLIGLKLHFQLTRAQRGELAGRVELLLFPGGYGGLEPIENGQANLCLLVRKERFEQAGNSMNVLVDKISSDCGYLARRLEGAKPIQNRPLAIASIPYGLVRQATSGCWHLGDQAVVIPSFAGEGMSIALHSAHLAAECYLTGGSAHDYQKHLACDVSAQIRRATLLSHLLVRRRAQKLVAAGVRFLPSALAAVAASTRLPISVMKQASP